MLLYKCTFSWFYWNVLFFTFDTCSIVVFLSTKFVCGAPSPFDIRRCRLWTVALKIVTKFHAQKKNVSSEHLLGKFTCALGTPWFKNHCREVNRSNSNRFQVGFKLLLLLLLDRRAPFFIIVCCFHRLPPLPLHSFANTAACTVKYTIGGVARRWHWLGEAQTGDAWEIWFGIPPVGRLAALLFTPYRRRRGRGHTHPRVTRCRKINARAKFDAAVSTAFVFLWTHSVSSRVRGRARTLARGIGEKRIENGFRTDGTEFSGVHVFRYEAMEEMETITNPASGGRVIDRADRRETLSNGRPIVRVIG